MSDSTERQQFALGKVWLDYADRRWTRGTFAGIPSMT
jgi:hypothetical protein